MSRTERRPDTMKKCGAGFQPAHALVILYAGVQSAVGQVGNLVGSHLRTMQSPSGGCDPGVHQIIVRFRRAVLTGYNKNWKTARRNLTPIL